MPETLTDAARRDAVDVAKAVGAAGRHSKWRLCSACGELGIPPGWSGVACWFCTPLVPVPFPDADGD